MKKVLELEALRGGAALYVFFHHTLFSFGIIEKSSFLGKVFSFGQEAVMIFFLLSGYVIALSLERRHYSFKEYFKHRFFRIYPIILIAWLVSFISLILINSPINFNITNVLINTFMLQDVSALKPGVLSDPLFGNSPLWSLSYEWWFYMLFFLHFYIYQKYFYKNEFIFIFSAFIISLIGLVTFKFHYNEISLISMYYFIWFSGAGVLLALKSKASIRKKVISIAIGYIALILIYIYLFIYQQTLSQIGVHPLLELRHFISAFIGLLAALFFYKYFYQKIKENQIYNKVIYLFSSLAPISFALYVLHYPIKNYFHHFSEINGWVLLTVTLLTTLILSYITEIKIYGYIRKKI